LINKISSDIYFFLFYPTEMNHAYLFVRRNDE
jgi:hypothetical protein